MFHNLQHKNYYYKHTRSGSRMVPKYAASKSEHILNQRILFYFYWLVWPTKYLLFYFNETALYVYLRLYVYILYNICPLFMSIWARFVLYVCDFPPKDHPYTSIEDCMAIRALRVGTITYFSSSKCNISSSNLIYGPLIVFDLATPIW